MLQGANLIKRYGRRTVVSGISLQVRPGEIVGLLGPNGAGKTTTFYMLTGLVAADGGQVSLNGADITRLPMHRRCARGIGYLPQEASVFGKLTVWANIYAIAELHHDKKTRAAITERLLGEFQLQHLAETKGAALSGGERRRVEIARALVANPKFMLLDEPFAGVDPISIGETKQMIAALKDRGIGVVISDHNVRETLSICARTYIISEGQILAAGTPADMVANEDVRRAYLGEDFAL